MLCCDGLAESLPLPPLQESALRKADHIATDLGLNHFPARFAPASMSNCNGNFPQWVWTSKTALVDGHIEGGLSRALGKQYAVKPLN